MKMPEVFINYYPHPKQLPFHEDRYEVKYRGLIAGTGAGKSKAGAKEALDWAWENPGSIGLIAAPAFRKFREIVVPAFEGLLNSKIDATPFFTNFNRMEMSLDVFNGSKIWMVGLDKPEASEGMNLDWAWVDEARLIPKFGDAWDSIRRRLRGSGLGKPLDEYVPENAVGAWITTTPDAPGSALHDFFEGRDKDPEAKVYRMSIMDNPHLPQDFIEGIKRTHTGGLYDRFVLGIFAAVGSGSFEFDYSIHVQGFKPPELRNIVFGVDFGWTNPSAIVAIALDGDNRAYVVDEFYQNRVSEQTLINECRRLKEKWGDGVFWCDSSEPRTISALNIQGLDARGNDSKRDDGIREVGGRFLDAGDGKRRLYISPECVNLIEELQLYKAEKKEHDHAVDALRYAVMGAKTVSGEIEVLSGWRPRASKRKRR